MLNRSGGASAKRSAASPRVREPRFNKVGPESNLRAEPSRLRHRLDAWSKSVLVALLAGFFAIGGVAHAQPLANQNYAGPHGAFSNFEQMEQAGPGRKGKNDPDITWERADKVDALKQAVSKAKSDAAPATVKKAGAASR